MFKMNIIWEVLHLFILKYKPRYVKILQSYQIPIHFRKYCPGTKALIWVGMSQSAVDTKTIFNWAL